MDLDTRPLSFVITAGLNLRARTRSFSEFLRFLAREGVTMPVGTKEHHHTDRIGWLRAAVLGANDGILSTSSLVLGVAAAQATHRNLLIAGMAGLVAGAMSMAAGESMFLSIRRQIQKELIWTLSAWS
jgi:hypothetical protein